MDTNRVNEAEDGYEEEMRPVDSALVAYARKLVEESDGQQVGNADCDWDDVEGSWDDQPEADRPNADEWAASTIRERLWEWNLADDRLEAMTQAIRHWFDHYDRLGAMATDPLVEAAWSLFDYLVADYGIDDFKDDADWIGEPPVPRPGEDPR